MSSDSQAIKTFVIAGSGLSLWLTAACLARALRGTGIGVTLVEDLRYGDFDARCDAGVPTDIALLNYLGVAHQQWVAASQGSYRLAQRYLGWSYTQQDYFLPFSDHGFQFDQLDFVQHWLHQQKMDSGFGTAAEVAGHFAQFSLAAQAARGNRFLAGEQNSRSLYAGLKFGVQINSEKYRELLKQYALANGVNYYAAKIARFCLDETSGAIAALQLDSEFPAGRFESYPADGRIQGDFFIDCSGAQALLLGQALDVRFHSAETQLLANAAASMLLETAPAGPQSFTQLRPEAEGWSLDIQTGCQRQLEYFFHAGSASCEQIIQGLNRYGDARQSLSFRPLQLGWRDKSWHKNCVALGEAAGDMGSFLFNKFYLVQTQLLRLMALLPATRDCVAQAAEFNRQTLREVNRVGDLHQLHLHLGAGLAGEFWQQPRPMPEALREPVQLFCARGLWPQCEGDLMSPGVWSSLLLGAGLLPQASHPLLDLDNSRAAGELEKMRRLIGDAAAAMPLLRDYLAQIAPVAASQRRPQPGSSLRSTSSTLGSGVNQVNAN